MAEQRKINKNALFCDETLHYRFPSDVKAGGTLTLRFRTEKDNVTAVNLVVSGGVLPMEKRETRGLFDYYEVALSVGENPIRYFFTALQGEEAACYDRLGVSDVPEAELRGLLNTETPEIPGVERLFEWIPGFSTPAWAKGAVMYQIFVDRFRNGDPENDVLTGEYAYLGKPVKRVEDWNALPEKNDTHRFYGGDLKGVLEKLDYLQYLGVEVLYLNPIFVSPSNHKYDSQDYDYIDPHFVGFPFDEGDLLPEGELNNEKATRYIARVTDERNLHYANAFFAHLTEEIHKRGMKIILDGVFNHCGSFHKWLDAQGIYKNRPGYEPGAYTAADSPYHDFFLFDKEASWPDHVTYKGWWNHKTLPKLNYEGSKELREYVMRIARKWVSPPYNIDGWRLDVAADLGNTPEFNHAFWREFRDAVKDANPNAIIIAEHYGDPKPWLNGAEWDTVMNYDAFMEPVTYFLTGMEKHSDKYNKALHGNGKAFFDTLLRKGLSLPGESLAVAMNELSNHDHSRFLTRTNRTVGRLATKGSEKAGEGVSYATFREGVVMQFTLPGAPTLYYGDETGVFGWTDPDSRRTYPWGREHWDLITFHRDMIRIHRKYSCLCTGSFKPLMAEFGFVAYGRFDEHYSALILVNHSDHDREISIPVSEIEVPVSATMTRVMKTNDAGYNVGRKDCLVESGILRHKVAAWSAEVLVYER